MRQAKVTLITPNGNVTVKVGQAFEVLGPRVDFDTDRGLFFDRDAMELRLNVAYYSQQFVVGSVNTFELLETPTNVLGVFRDEDFIGNYLTDWNINAKTITILAPISIGQTIIIQYQYFIS